MIAVALIVLLLALLLTVMAIAGGVDSVTLDLFGSRITTSAAGLYLTGLITGAAVLAALWLLRTGLKKGWQQRRRIKDLQRRAEHADESPSESAPTADGPPTHPPSTRPPDDDPSTNDKV